MKKQPLRFLKIIALLTVIVSVLVSCDDTTNADKPVEFPKGSGWPEELVPQRNDFKEISLTQWEGEYRDPTYKNNILALLRSLKKGVDTSEMGIVILKSNFTANFDVVEVSGKMVKVKCTYSSKLLIPGQIYTFCTDWTLTGSGTGAVLTLIGSEMPDIFTAINWTVP